MKKTSKTKLRLDRETVRTLQAYELRQVDGGGAIPVTLIQCPPPPLTSDSRICCCA